MSRRIAVEIVGDSSSLERAFARSSKSASRFNRDISGMTRGAAAGSGAFRGFGRSLAFASGGFLTGAGAVAAIKASVTAASDFNEQVAKTEVVFGKSAAAVKAWSETTTSAFGISRREALATASSFGAMLAPLQITGQEAAKQSEQLTQLGADLASFYNTSVQDALDAIRSGLVGEAEPLRRYGVLLSETRVQQEALAETGKRHASQLTAQEKVLARIALIYKDSAQAQGDFARTSDGLANQTRQLKANMDDLAVVMGETLIPVVNTAVGAFNEFFALLRDNANIGAETFAKGSKLETTLVPDLAKQIQAFNPKASKRDIIAALRRQLGGGLKADDLIAEAFSFASGSDPKLRARIEAQARGAAKAVQAAAKGRPLSLQGRFNLAELKLAEAQLTKTEADNRRILTVEKAIVEQQIKSAKTLKDKTKLTQQLAAISGQILSIDQQSAEAAKQKTQALKDQADAIKSAVLDRLQGKQAATENQRAVRDALANLHTAQLLGGPAGIRLARQAVADARFTQRLARLEAAPATLGGGVFRLGAMVTVNVHGTTDPDAVARKVVDIIQRRSRHTTKQSRGPSAGAATGPH